MLHFWTFWLTKKWSFFAPTAPKQWVRRIFYLFSYFCISHLFFPKLPKNGIRPTKVEKRAKTDLVGRPTKQLNVDKVFFWACRPFYSLSYANMLSRISKINFQLKFHQFLPNFIEYLPNFDLFLPNFDQFLSNSINFYLILINFYSILLNICLILHYFCPILINFCQIRSIFTTFWSISA